MGLNDYRQSSVGSEERLFFLDTAQQATVSGGSVTGGEFHMMFLRAESTNVENGISLEETPDVTLKIQPLEPQRGTKQIQYSGVFLKDDPVCQALLKLFDENPIGAKAHFYMVEVRTFDSNSATIADVAIVTTAVNADAGDKIKIEATIGYTSDPVKLTQTVSIDADEGTLSFS